MRDKEAADNSVQNIVPGLVLNALSNLFSLRMCKMGTTQLFEPQDVIATPREEEAGVKSARTCPEGLRQARSVSKDERRIWCLALGLSVLANVLFWGHPFGLSALVFSAAAVLGVFWVFGRRLCDSPRTLVLHIFLIACLAFAVALNRNAIIQWATLPCLFMLLAALPLAMAKGYSFAGSLNVAAGVVQTAFGSVSLATRMPPAVGSSTARKFMVEHKTGQSLIGILCALPFILVFVFLFASADAVFEGWARGLWNWLTRDSDAELIFRTGAILAMTAALCLYLLNALVSPPDCSAGQEQAAPGEPMVSHMAAGGFIYALGALFLIFIIIQLDYLFGGERVIRTTSLTYAEYAHRGFGAFVAILLLTGLIVGTISELVRSTVAIPGILRAAQSLLVLEILIILISAEKRIWIYQQAYGWTYLRVLVALFEMWCGIVLLIFLVRTWRDFSLVRLAGWSLSSAFTFLLLVSLGSIDGFTARRNILRTLENGYPVDTTYLETLSVDSAPALVLLLKESKNPHLRRWATGRVNRIAREEPDTSPWGWNYGVSRARRIAAELVEGERDLAARRARQGPAREPIPQQGF